MTAESFSSNWGNLVEEKPVVTSSISSSAKEKEILVFQTDNSTKICEPLHIKRGENRGYRLRRNYQVGMRVVGHDDVEAGDSLRIRMVHYSEAFRHRPIFACTHHNDSGGECYPFYVHRDGFEMFMGRDEAMHFYCPVDFKETGGDFTFKSVCNNTCHQQACKKYCAEGKCIDIVAEVLDARKRVKYFQRIPVQVGEQLRGDGGKKKRVKAKSGHSRPRRAKRRAIKRDVSTTTTEESDAGRGDVVSVDGDVLTDELVREVRKYGADLEARGEKRIIKHWIRIFRNMNIAQK